MFLKQCLKFPMRHMFRYVSDKQAHLLIFDSNICKNERLQMQGLIYYKAKSFKMLANLRFSIIFKKTKFLTLYNLKAIFTYYKLQTVYKMHSSSKYPSLSPSNQFYRPQRDISPSNKHQSKSSKHYSSQDVSKMIKAYIQPKLNFLRNQLQSKQQIIQTLNQKLDQNDDRLNKMYNYTETIIRKQKQYSGNYQQQKHSQTITIINQLLNDKLKQYWETITMQVGRMKEQFVERNVFDSRELQKRIEQEILLMKSSTSQFIQQCRTRNNSYWLKIKEALNRINSKLTKTQQAILNTNQSIQKFKQKSLQQYSVINQLSKSKQVVKKLIELKKSVDNIYDNYQNVLEVQQKFKIRVNQNGRWGKDQKEKQQQSSQLIDFSVDEKGGEINYRKNHHQEEFYHANKVNNNAGNTFPMFRKKHNNDMNMQKRGAKFDESQEQIVLQYSRQELANSQMVQTPLSNTMSHQKQNNARQEPQKNNFPTKYYVPQTNFSQKNSKFMLHQSSPLKNSPPHSSSTSKYDNQLFSPSPNQLSCLNSTSNAFPHTNSRSTSFVNLSLQNRQQMSESLKQRLQQIIELKNLTKPLLVYLDEINYLKNAEGNYIFDIKGNMFKVSKEEGKQLERLGVIRWGDRTGNSDGRNIDGNGNKNMGHAISKSVKRNNIMNANSPVSSLQLNSNTKSKSLNPNQATKIKSIMIKQSVI